MPHYGILREYKLEDIDDVRGADVYGVNDEKLGTIDDVIFDHSNGDIRYIVLKTGGLLSKRRIMVPANRIQSYGNHDDKFYAELDKDRLEMLPEFNDETMKSESDWADFEKNYEERWKDGTVMYNKDTGRIITPPAAEQPQTSTLTDRQAHDIAARDLTPERLIKTPGHQDDYLGVASGTGKTTLQPKKPSIAGRASVAGESQLSESHQASPTDAIREPGVYTLDALLEPGSTPNLKQDVNEPPNEALNAGYGRRWKQFQQKLREHRDQVISGCDLCGTQDKAA